jgi:hypothetical protein
MLIGASTHAAPCEFAVNHDRRHTADAIALRLGRQFRFVHVMNDYLVGRPSKPFDDFYSFSARWATSAEDLNLLFCSHDVLLSVSFDFICAAVAINGTSCPQTLSK